MAAKVGALLVDMALNTAAFASDLAKTQNSLNSWATRQNRVLGTVVNGYRNLSKELTGFVSNALSMRNVMLTLTGAGGLGLLVTNSISAASAMVDLADNIGVSTKALQEYRFAARLSSISTQDLDSNLEQFSKRLGDLRAGQGALFNFLKNTNPQLLEQMRAAKSVDEAFNLLIGSMGRMEKQQDRLALAAAAFGKGGLSMVNLVKDGTAAFEEMRRKANELGVVIEDGLLRRAEEAGDSLDILAMVLRAQLITAVAENAQEIQQFAEALIRAIPKVMEIGTAILNVVTQFLDWRRTMLMAQQDLIKIGATAQIAAMSVASIFRGGPDTADIEAFAKKADAEIKAIDEKIRNIGKPAGGMGKDAAVLELDRLLAQGKTAPSGGSEGYTESMKRQADAAKDAAAELTKLKSAGEAVYRDTRTPLEQYTNQEQKLNEMLKANVIDMETYTRAIGKAKGELSKAQTEGSLFIDIMDAGLKGQIKSWKDLGQVILDFANRALREFIMTGQSASLQGSFGQGGGGGGGFLGNLLGGIGGMFNNGGQAGLPWQSFGSVNPAGGMYLGSFATGIDRVPRDGFAKIHEDEAVLPAREAEAWRNGGSMEPAGDTYYINAPGATQSQISELKAMILSLAGKNRVEDRVRAAMTRGAL